MARGPGSKRRKGKAMTRDETGLEQRGAKNSNVTSEQEEEEGRFGYDCQVILGCVHLTPNIVAAEPGSHKKMVRVEIMEEAQR